MSNQWWLGYVQGGKCTKAEGEYSEGERRRERILKQFYVEREIRAMGIDCWLPRRIEFRRTGKKRRAEPFEVPYLMNYIFIDLPVDRFLEVSGVKYMTGTLMPLRRDDISDMGAIRTVIDAEYAKAQKAAQSRSEISEYVAGEKIRMINDRFGDQIMQFVSMVERSHDLYPKVKASMDMMGRQVMVEVDPLDIRATE